MTKYSLKVLTRQAIFKLWNNTLWWWSSLFLLGSGTANFAIMFFLTDGLTRQELQEAGCIHMLPSYSLGALAVILPVYNVAFELSVGNYIFLWC